MKKCLKSWGVDEYVYAMNFKRIILPIIFLASACLSAQQSKGDPVIVESVSFKTVSKSDIVGIGGNVLRGEVVILPKIITEEVGDNNWARNIEIELSVAFSDQKGKSGFQMMTSRAKIFAAERNKKTAIVFYIPWESYSIYRMNKEPEYYIVEMWVNGNKVPITNVNYKQRISKNFSSVKDMEDFIKAIASQGGANKSVLKPLNECATNIQTYEYGTSRNPTPTYLDIK